MRFAPVYPVRPSARAAFVDFTARLEGVVPWMYADVFGYVTTGIGNLIDTPGAALMLPWRRADGSLAQRDEVLAEWARVKNDPNAAKYGHRYTGTITHLRLTTSDINDLVQNRLNANESVMRSRFANWEDWPADGHLATLSMCWAVGPHFHRQFPKLEAALQGEASWIAASLECGIREEKNPGIAPRNRANRLMYRNAHYAEDPAVLYYPRNLEAEQDDEPTQPSFRVVYAMPDPPPRSIPVIFFDDEDDDPPEAA